MNLREHLENGHEVIEDMFVYECCRERLFCCLTCRKFLIVDEINGELVLREELDSTLQNSEISKHLTWED